MSRRVSKQSSERGFTLVELLVATTVFSVLLLFGLAAVVQVGRMYYKGVTTAQTQQTARAILDQVTQNIQLSSANIRGANGYIGGATSGDMCIGDQHFSFVIDKQQSNPKVPMLSGSQSKHVLWADTVSSCADVAGVSTHGLDVDTPSGHLDGRELIGARMRLTRLVVQPLPGATGLYRVEVSVVYGDEDLLTPPDAQGRRTCKGAYAGTQFCAISELSTVVKKRI